MPSISSLSNLDIPGVKGEPSLSLPVDHGDQPVLTDPSKHTNDSYATRANIGTEKVDNESQQDLHKKLDAGERVETGGFTVVDYLKPDSFKRVTQYFPSIAHAAFDFSVRIEFKSNFQAVQALADEMEPEAKGAMGKAQKKINEINSSAPNTLLLLPAETAQFSIRFRLPGMELENSDVTKPPAGLQNSSTATTNSPNGRIQSTDSMSNIIGGYVLGNQCVDPLSDMGLLTKYANTVVEFPFTNSGSSKWFSIPWPTDRTIPVVFDLINRDPINWCPVQIMVEVSIQKSKAESSDARSVYEKLSGQ